MTVALCAVGLALLMWPPAQPRPRHRLAVIAPPAIDVGRLPLVLDLTAVALRAGAAPGTALAAAAHGGGDGLRPILTEVAGLLKLGVEPASAWARARAIPELATIATAAERSARSGARLAEVLANAAEDLRDQQVAAARTAAARVAVWAVLPLGLCFLPAFVCLGVIPAVAGITGELGPSLL